MIINAQRMEEILSSFLFVFLVVEKSEIYWFLKTLILWLFFWLDIKGCWKLCWNCWKLCYTAERLSDFFCTIVGESPTSHHTPPATPIHNPPPNSPAHRTTNSTHIPHFHIQFHPNTTTFPHKPRQINTLPNPFSPLSTPLQPIKSPHFYPKITPKFRIFSPTLTPKNTTFCPSSPTFATLSINCKNTKNAKKSNNGTSRKSPTEIK